MLVTADMCKATAVALLLFLMNYCEMQPVERDNPNLELEYKTTAKRG